MGSSRSARSCRPARSASTCAAQALDDGEAEEAETVALTLSNPSGGYAGLSRATATGTIEDGGTGGQGVPGEALTAAFEDLPGGQDGSTAFSVRLAFSEEFPVTEAAIRAGLAVTGATLDAVVPAAEGEHRRWNVTVTPATQADAVRIALAPKESCAAENAICTTDGRGLSETVEARVEGRPPTVVTGVAVTSGPGGNGTWDAGETVDAEVRFSDGVTVVAPPGTGPVLTVLLDGVARQAAYHGGTATAALTFRHADVPPR